MTPEQMKQLQDFVASNQKARQAGIDALKAALDRIEALERQNTDLQANNTKLVLENRELRKNTLRCLAYDSCNFIDDVKTPYKDLMKPAFVYDFKFDRYGRLTAYFVFEDGRKASQFSENLRPLPTPPQTTEDRE